MSEQKLYQWFTENDVRSISPHIGILLIEIAEEITPKLIQIKDQELRERLQTYRDALVVVVGVASTHQKAVIDKLDVLITSRENKEE